MSYTLLAHTTLYPHPLYFIYITQSEPKTQFLAQFRISTQAPTATFLIPSPLELSQYFQALTECSQVSEASLFFSKSSSSLSSSFSSESPSQGVQWRAPGSNQRQTSHCSGQPPSATLPLPRCSDHSQRIRDRNRLPLLPNTGVPNCAKTS